MFYQSRDREEVDRVPARLPKASWLGNLTREAGDGEDEDENGHQHHHSAITIIIILILKEGTLTWHEGTPA